MIIDVRGHAGPWFFSTDVGAVEVNPAMMDRYGIDRRIVSASEAVTYDMVSGNRWATSRHGADRTSRKHVEWLVIRWMGSR